MDLWLYVYGNGDFIYTILTSLNFFMQNARSFFTLATILSLLFFAFESTGVLPTRGYDWMKFSRVYILMSLFVLTPYPGPVNVHDVITNQDRVFNFSDNKLPIGMIFPIAVTSTVIYRLINLYQQNFEIDENLNYTYSGMNFGANFIQALDNATSYDPNFDYNLDLYMQNCGFPLVNKAGALSELRRSGDIFATLKKYTSTARFVQQTDYASGNTSVVVSCDKAITDINAYYEANKDAIMHYNAQMMGVSTNTGYDRYITAADASATDILKISQGASAAMKQAIGMNVMMSSLKNGAQSVGNGNLALAAYDAEQFQQYKTTSALSGAASARTIPILVGIGFALLFFLYPIIIFMAIAMGAYRGIGVFFQILVGINLIPLIYEILNYLTTFYLEKKLGVIVQGQGYSYEISTSLYSFTDNMIVAGNYLATASPLIAYAIVTGSSMALTSVFSHINDPAKSQSAQVGEQYAKGNQSIGNASVDTYSYNNLQGNKLDDQLSMSSGSPLMKNSTAGGTTSNIGGQTYSINNKDDLLATPNLTQSATHSLQNSLSHSKQDMSQLSNQWSNQASRLHDLNNQISSDQKLSQSMGTDEKRSLQNQEMLATNIAATAKGGFEFMGSGGGINGDISSTKRAQFNKDLASYDKHSKDFSDSNNQSLRDTFSNSSSMVASTSSTAQDIVNKSQALSDVQSTSSSINSNFSKDFAGYIRDQGLNPTELNATQQTELGSKFVDKYVNDNYGINNNLAAPSANTQQFSHGQAPNANGLDMPSTNTQMAIDANKQQAKVHAATNEFVENPGNVVGNQVIEQAKTAGNVLKNTAEQMGGIMYNVAHPDRAIPEQKKSTTAAAEKPKYPEIPE